MNAEHGEENVQVKKMYRYALNKHCNVRVLSHNSLIMHFCDSNQEITRSSKKKYNNIKDH